MKAIKYLVMGALLTGFSTTAMAQELEAKAAIDAIKNKSGNVAELVKVAQKKNKKNADALIAIARAYYEQGDTANARVNANLALEAGKQQYAPAYILLGDIEAVANEGGKAASYYNQAVYFDPKNPDGYYKYALVYRKISPSGAVQKLNDLKAQRPDVEVDALSGHIYYLSNEFDKAIKSYAKVPLNKMEKNDLIEYAMSNFFLQKHADGLKAVEEGLKKEPRNAGFNRLGMFFNTELKNYDKAIEYGDALFNRSDSAKFSYMDYTYLGNAYNGLKQADKAIEQYEKALNTEFDNKAKRAGVVKALSDAYVEKEDFDSAIKYYKEYMSAFDKPSANDLAGLAGMFLQKGATLKDAAAKKEAFMMADAAYADLENKYVDAQEYVNFMRARVNLQLDPEQKQGLAKPYYEKLIELIAPKAEKSKSDITRLTESYRYLISYYLVANDDKETAKSFATKLQEIDPENEIAKQVLEMK